MKHSLLTLLLITCFQGFAQTNMFHPYPQSWGATWQNELVVGLPGGPSYNYIQREWGGDTTINSTVYTKVYSGIGSGHQFIGGIRQNIALEEAYFIDDQNLEHDISFNQNASVGDTVLTSSMILFIPNPILDTLFIVNSIDSISIQGSYRKSFTITPLDVSSNIVQATFLSGVGFVNSWGFEWGASLQCHSVDHNWLYGGPPNPTCVLSTDELPLELSINIFPNPTFGLMKISKSPNFLRLYSCDGKEVNVDQYVLHNDILDISRCSKGVYHAYFEFDTGVVIKRIILQKQI